MNLKKIKLYLSQNINYKVNIYKRSGSNALEVYFEHIELKEVIYLQINYNSIPKEYNELLLANDIILILKRYILQIRFDSKIIASSTKTSHLIYLIHYVII